MNKNKHNNNKTDKTENKKNNENKSKSQLINIGLLIHKTAIEL